MSIAELRKSDLMENILRQYKLLHDSEAARDVASTPREIARLDMEIASIKVSITGYVNEYARLCGKSDVPQDLLTIMGELRIRELAPELITEVEAAVIRVLFLSASPTDLVRLRVDQEARDIQEELERAKMWQKYQFHIRPAVRAGDLTRAMLDVEPRIVHFSGHGSRAGALYVENDLGDAHPVAPKALASMFKLFSEQVECVLMNACYAKRQANAIAEHIPYVIGMSEKISDKAAPVFSVGFYRALGAGKSIEQAYEFGVVQLRLLGIPEDLAPVLVRKG